VCVYTYSSREGLCCFCQGFFFKLDLTVLWAALPVAVLKFVAFFCGILALHSMVRGFKVSLFTDSTVVDSVANNSKANSELMQMVHTALLASAAFASLCQGARTQYITTGANTFLDAGTCSMLSARFAALCEQAGVRARRVPLPAEFPALLDALWLLRVNVVARAPPPCPPPPQYLSLALPPAPEPLLPAGSPPASPPGSPP
jgi:hypothetical protein